MPPVLVQLSPDLDAICAEIRHFHRQRQFAIHSRTRTDNALGAFLRTALGWSLDATPKERLRIEKAAAAAIEAGEVNRKTGIAPDDDVYLDWQQLIDGTIASRAPFDSIEASAKKEMETLAKSLPVWEAWAKEAKGFGAVSLAAIVGEAGNLDGYATHSKLWKRMGLAVMGDVRQGGLKKTAKAADWIAHGYSKQRRSIMWVIGDVLIKQRETATYRQHYLARKAIEVEKAAARGQIVEPASKRTKEQPDKFMSAMHVHRRAQRWVEKRLLRDLWRAWTIASSASSGLPETANKDMPIDASDDGHGFPVQAINQVPSSQSAIVAMPAGAEAELPSGSDDGQVALADQASDTARSSARVAKGELPGTPASLLLPPAFIDDGLTTDAVEAVPNLPSSQSSVIITMPRKAKVALLPTDDGLTNSRELDGPTGSARPGPKPRAVDHSGATARMGAPETARPPMLSPREASE